VENNPKDISSTLSNNPFETSPGLTIDDLNKYLSAVQTSSDILLSKDRMLEGLFLLDPMSGLRRVPDESIDLIISEPPKEMIAFGDTPDNPLTLQDYYKWNNNWLSETKRILKKTGAIYLLTNWKNSSMYQSLLANFFKVQSRIIWKSKSLNSVHDKKWVQSTADIWFATKTDDYLFRGNADTDKLSQNNISEQSRSDLWVNIPEVTQKFERHSQVIYRRLLKASTTSLNWVLDPFMSVGDVGVASKNLGRRFIGFEEEKDSLLLAMKRIDKN
jgi:site-specific DNA-methyltransferase (adenine-specific)